MVTMANIDFHLIVIPGNFHLSQFSLTLGFVTNCTSVVEGKGIWNAEQYGLGGILYWKKTQNTTLQIE